MTVTPHDQTSLIHFHASLYQTVISRQRYHQEVKVSLEMNPMDKDYLFLIHETLRRLTHEEQRLLRNDFLSPLSKNWWMEFYSKSTYYRLRHLAVDRFLDCLHHEKMV